MKNPNGYGTVYKLSGKRRRPYMARVTSGWGDDGKQLYDVIGYYESRKGAMTALTEYWKGGVKQRDGLTLEDVYNEWSEIKFVNISTSTIKQYKAAFQKLKPIWRVRFCDLRTSHFQKIIHQNQSMLKKGTLEKIKLLAGLLYEYAIQNDFAAKNYAHYIELPKEDKREKRIFTDLEIQTLWENLDKPYADTVLILIYTGMRIGELLKLTRFNVDLQNQIITGGLKTEAGKNRMIPISEKILPLIENRMQESGPLFPYSYSKYKANFSQLMTDLNITGVTPHSTRHTFVTLMARGGADAKALQKIIGHANYSTTMDIYTHTDIADLKKAIKSI